MKKITAWKSWADYRACEEWTMELPGGGDLPWALFYPADYSIGSANLGMHYIFRLLREAGVAAERFFPSPVPYRSVDGDTLLERFPVIAAGVSFESGVEEFFKWLNGAGIPLDPRERARGSYPVVGAGGALTYINPLLLSGVCDFIIMGDGMDVLPYAVECLRTYASDGDREKLWSLMSEEPCILVPPVDIKNGVLRGGKKIGRTIEIDGTYPMHSTWVTPESAFGNTLLVELQRGCARNCKYCTLPGCFGRMRYRNFDILRGPLEKLTERLHFDQVGLVTPEAGDYPDIERLLDFLEEKGKGVSFASLRLDRLTEKMVSALTRGSRRSITVAPETGSDELRFSCGKKFTNELVLDKLEMAARMGIDQVKLYFMTGLPGESDDDILSIAALCRAIIERTGQRLVISAGPFIPKPGTPWAVEDFIGAGEARRRYSLLGREIRAIKHKTPQMRLTSTREAEEEFVLAWSGYYESVRLADDIVKYGKRKFSISNRERTLEELKKIK